MTTLRALSILRGLWRRSSRLQESVMRRPPGQTAFVVRLMLIQLGALMVAPIVCLAWSLQSAQAALFGGLIYLLPSVFFTCCVFLLWGAPAAPQLLRSLLLAEILKLVLVAIGFAVVFTRFEDINVLALFAGFFIVLLSAITSPSWLVSQPPSIGGNNGH